MKLVLLSFFDKKTSAFTTPFFAQTAGAGLRSASDLVNSGEAEQPPARHPEDFSVHVVGYWDDRGVLEGQPAELVAECVNLRAEVVK